MLPITVSTRRFRNTRHGDGIPGTHVVAGHGSTAARHTSARHARNSFSDRQERSSPSKALSQWGSRTGFGSQITPFTLSASTFPTIGAVTGDPPRRPGENYLGHFKSSLLDAENRGGRFIRVLCRDPNHLTGCSDALSPLYAWPNQLSPSHRDGYR